MMNEGANIVNKARRMVFRKVKQIPEVKGLSLVVVVDFMRQFVERPVAIRGPRDDRRHKDDSTCGPLVVTIWQDSAERLGRKGGESLPATKIKREKASPFPRVRTPCANEPSVTKNAEQPGGLACCLFLNAG
jgi:hypothetical protein